MRGATPGSLPCDPLSSLYASRICTGGGIGCCSFEPRCAFCAQRRGVRSGRRILRVILGSALPRFAARGQDTIVWVSCRPFDGRGMFVAGVSGERLWATRRATRCGRELGCSEFPVTDLKRKDIPTPRMQLYACPPSQHPCTQPALFRNSGESGISPRHARLCGSCLGLAGAN